MPQSCDQSPLAFKARCCGDSSSCCQNPRLGSLLCGSEVSLLWENLCNIVCGTATQWVLDLILLLLCPFYHSTGASLFTGCRISFVVGSGGWFYFVVVDDCLTVHCDFHFSYKEVSSYSSTLSSCLCPLSQVKQSFFFLQGSSW